MRTYHKELPSSLADSYLTARGFGERTKKLFELGYRANPNELWAGKLHIPIRDKDGRLVSYAERVLDDSTPKYVNGAASAIYNKSELLYGFNLLPTYADSSRIYVVEGYSDVWRMAERNLFAVAICGTAFTEHQCQLLLKTGSKIILTLDNDSAGKNATVRALKLIADKFPKQLDQFAVWNAHTTDIPYNDVADYLAHYDCIESVSPVRFLQALAFIHNPDRLYIANKLAAKGNYQLLFDMQGAWS